MTTIGLVMLTLAGAAGAQERPPAGQIAPADAFLGLETMRLWAGRAPGAIGDGADETPTLTIFRPQSGTGNGTAVIVAPGGGYVALAGVLEGREVADWFTSRGITAFVLRYRIGAKARLPIPLLDGRRAVRYVRANAATLKIDPARIGMIGFSAGGHLTASVAGVGDSVDADAIDSIDRTSAKVDFAILGYPWLNATVVGADGTSQYCAFARRDCAAKEYVKFNPLAGVTAAFPPTFIYHTSTDALVRPDGSVALYSALLAAKVPVELHIFADGPHGTGLGGMDPALARWPDLLEQWLRARGLLTRAKR